MENYSMCKLSDRLFGFVVIFNLDNRLFLKKKMTNLGAVVKYKLQIKGRDKMKTVVQTEQKL